ncbi:hypothetical protein L218DRAFT_971848 [Marasmius fiardii PR-910]|nr:hypothetical protein L218DRAFT_971848 [Marasmius fiardii PR-910]
MASKRLSRVLNWINPSTKDRGTSTSASVKPSRSNNWANLPTFDELPKYKDFDGCAWEVWGKDDQLGTVNLLTEDVVKRAAIEEIALGKSPLFGRKIPEIIMKPKAGRPGRDDEINMNTQSGSQWDGLRHFGLMDHGVFYNEVHMDTMVGGVVPLADPKNIDPALAQIGIQNWAEHGICGRGVLIDLVHYYTATAPGAPERKLPYDPWSTHGFTVKELEAVAAKQGVQFRQGDILLIRAGFIKKYQDSTQEERDALAGKPETFAGIEQSTEMKKFLCHLRSWPKPEEVPHLHQLKCCSLWGMPIGEMFDLEKLSEVCAQTGRYTFFFSSWPLPIIGGCASPPNAACSDHGGYIMCWGFEILNSRFLV